MLKSLVTGLGQGVSAWLAGSRLTGYLTQTSDTSIGRGQYLGTNTNDVATAGNIGEYLAAQSSVSFNLANNVISNLCSISLEAGDYDVWGMVAFQCSSTGTTTLNNMQTSVNLSSNAITGALDCGQLSYPDLAPGPDRVTRVLTNTVRFSLSTTTTVYLNCYQLFGVSTLTGTGLIKSRRMR